MESLDFWLDHFKSLENSLPRNDTTLRPKYSLLCRRLAFTSRTLHIHKKLDGDLPDRFEHLQQNFQSICDASSNESGSESLPMMLRALLQDLHKINGMLSLKASAFSDAYPHHREATINPTFDIEGDPFAEVYHDSDPCLDSFASADFLQLFEDLDLTGKYLFMYFSVFPAYTVIDKRTLVYWCMAIGVLNPTDSQVDRVVDVILEELVVKGFVEAEQRNFKLVGFKVCPLVRCFAVKVAERFSLYAFNEGVPSFSGIETSNVVLSREGMGSSLDNLLSMNDEGLQKVECILNVNELYPNFDLIHFTKMKNLSALCLGVTSADQHIEVQSLDFLRGLKVPKKMAVLSLRGISQVFLLPDTLFKHVHLRVLDLNSCHNLELLPKEIGLLKNLTHLDISKCYLLDRMPKGLASLTELRVFKGFLVVADEASCAFSSLVGLKKLSKMSLYVHKIDFPNDLEQTVFKEFSLLRDFTIQWGGPAVKRKQGSGDKAGDIFPSKRLEGGTDIAGEVPNNAQVAIEVGNVDQSKPLERKKGFLSRLPTFQRKKDSAGESAASGTMLKAVEKLVLQCCPQEELPKWLVPSNVPLLKQLHIKGGKLQSFGNAWTNGASKLEMLRLNYLNELKMDMNDLKTYFPKLNRLAKLECPELSGFPEDDDNITLPLRDHWKDN